MRRGGEGEKEERMRQRLWFIGCIVVVLTCTLGVAPAPAAPPEGTLTVAVATFGNERWLPHQYVAAEDIVLKPMLENLLSRDLNTGSMSSMLAERWEVLDGGRTWKFHLRQGIQFHDGWGEVTAEDVKFTLAAIDSPGALGVAAGWVP
jgi:peptide/nickel transport system substrate-binding protein